MKKKLLLITVSLMLIIFVSIMFVVKNSSAVSSITNTDSENVSFVVYKSSDYTSAVYNSASAKLHVTIEKVNRLVKMQ